MLIVLVDVIVFVMLTVMTGMAYDDFAMQYSDTLDLEGKGIAFTLLTDGFILLIFFVRMMMGLYYVRKSIWPPKMDYQYIIEFGKLKWHTKRVKTMRINFKNYTLASNISSFFILTQTTVLLFVSWFQTEMYFRYIFLILLTTFTIIMLPFINSHL